MPKLFGVNIQGLVAKHIGPGVFPATLTSITPGTRVAGKLTQGTVPTETDYSGKGFVDTYNDDHIDGTLVKASDRKIILIWGTFPTTTPFPKSGDKITIEGETYKIVKDGVSRDPASATFTCQSRK